MLPCVLEFPVACALHPYTWRARSEHTRTLDGMSAYSMRAHTGSMRISIVLAWHLTRTCLFLDFDGLVVLRANPRRFLFFLPGVWNTVDGTNPA